jgi:Fe-S-cluster containining protein
MADSPIEDDIPEVEMAAIDCDAGREMGCTTFCCRLIVRLKDHERAQFDGAGTLEKSEDGLCCYLDRESYLCSIWDKRPGVCREYTCNDDYLLQVVLREGFTNLVNLAKSKIFIPKETYIKIPVGDTGGNKEK